MPTQPTAPALDPAPYLTIETGTLPVVLSAPHGGTTAVAGVPARQSGTTVLDTNTYQLAAAIQTALVSRTGRRAHLVASLASRSYVDFNRSASEAYETAAVAPLYEAYHAAVRAAVSTARAQAPTGALLVDIHGQGTDAAVVFRGTRAGLTASLPMLYAPTGGFLTRLMALWVDVSPATANGSENPSFDGGHIVATYGLAGSGGIGAVQLEFGLNYRQAVALETTAGRVAEAIVEHLRVHAPGVER